MRKVCQLNPNQNMKILNPREIVNSDEFKSSGDLMRVVEERPKRELNQFRKKNVGPKK
jgi:hypothetical protein